MEGNIFEHAGNRRMSVKEQKRKINNIFIHLNNSFSINKLDKNSIINIYQSYSLTYTSLSTSTFVFI